MGFIAIRHCDLQIAMDLGQFMTHGDQRKGRLEAPFCKARFAVFLCIDVIDRVGQKAAFIDHPDIHGGVIVQISCCGRGEVVRAGDHEIGVQGVGRDIDPDRVQHVWRRGRRGWRPG